MCSPFLCTDTGNTSEKLLRVDMTCTPFSIIEKLLLILLVLIVCHSKFFLGEGGNITCQCVLPCVALKVNGFNSVLANLA